MPADQTPSPTVSIVLPCLNEAASVGLCVEEARGGLAAAGLAGEVVVVDNGSVDDSAAIARAAGARVVHEAVPGYGSALRAGIAAAEGDIVVMADADTTYDLSQVGRVVAPVAAGEADMVLASRLDGATRETMPFLHRAVGTPMLTFLVARACGRRLVTDSQSGYRAFRRADLNALGLTSTGMEFASEMLIRAAYSGWRVREVAAGYRARIGDSKLRTFSDGWRHLQLILLLAPDLLLVGPGATLLGLGVLLTILGFVQGSTIELGSLRWQPVFFSSIALVLGMQALLAGAVLANRSSLAKGSVRRRFAFVGAPSFPNRALALGAFLLLAGLALDIGLFVAYTRGSPTPPTGGFAIASLAQSLLMVGGTLASFGVIARYLFARDTTNTPSSASIATAAPSTNDTSVNAR